MQPATPLLPKTIRCYRVVAAGRDPLSSSLSLQAGGRYNQAGAFGVLYASLDESAAVAEVATGLRVRGIDPSLVQPGDFWIYALDVSVTSLLDLTDADRLSHLNIAAAELIGENTEITQKLSAQAKQSGYQGLLVPSAGQRGSINLVVFPELLEEAIDIVGQRALLRIE